MASESVSVDFYLCDGGAQPIFVYGSDVEASISSKPHFMVCSKDNPEEVSYLKVCVRMCVCVYMCECASVFVKLDKRQSRMIAP